MRVEILGPLRVIADGERGGEVVEIGGSRLRALLVRLALDAGQTLTVHSLAEAVWPGAGPADPAHALQSLMTRLRRALPDGSVLRSVPPGYRLDLPPQAVDAVRFEQLAREGARLLKAGEAGAARQVLTEALALWRGPALSDAADAPYAMATSARLEELRLTVLEDRIEADLALQTGRPALELAELTATHPLRERSLALLIRALHAEGRRAEALAAYERFRQLLAEELGTDPGAELRAAHLAVLRGEVPARRRRRGNLRAPITSFVGRERERKLVGELLERARLVTLVGPGGVGKTRLASTVGAELQERRPGGVWLVELAVLRDPADVPVAIASALDLLDSRVPDSSSGPRDAVARLVGELSSGAALLVLDNCEHLLDGVARVVEELLGSCPALRVLATSREPLGITGESLCAVPPLELPEAGAAVELSPAARLFADRAGAVRPGFAITVQNGATVAEICRRLDGLPLAIELAAARLRMMSLEQLAARLDDRFQVLTGGSRTVLSRHRTLRAVIAWSWDLLDDEERWSAERLAVFPSSFDPDAARHLGVSQDALDALVDKSLLQVADDAMPRYRMLDTIREYGAGRLVERGAHAATRAAHAAYFLALAEQAAPHLQGPEQLTWIARLTLERDNLSAALEAARESGDAATAVRLAAALGLYWTIHGEHADAAGRLRPLLDLPGEAPLAARRNVMAVYLFNAVLAGESAEARTRGGEIAALTDADDPLGVLLASLYALISDRSDAASAAAARWLDGPGQRSMEPWKQGMLRLVKSFAEGSRGQWRAMADDLSAAAEDFRASGDRWGLATSLTYRAAAQLTLGELDDAIAVLESSLALTAELGNDQGQRLWLAIVRLYAGHRNLARAELAALATGAEYVSTRRRARTALAELARREDDLAEAARQLELVAEEQGGDPFRDAMYVLEAGQLATAKGELDQAAAHLLRALGLAVDMPDLPLVAAVAVGVASLVRRRGDASGAARVLGAAHGLRGAADAYHIDISRLAEELTGRLGERAYRDCYRHGRELTRDDALALIRAGIGEVVPEASGSVTGQARRS